MKTGLYIAALLSVLLLPARARAITLDIYGGVAGTTCPAVSWQSSHVYAVGVLVRDSNGNEQEVTTAGTSGGSVPSWTTTIGNTTADNTATWTRYGWYTAKLNGRWWICDPLNNVYYFKSVTESQWDFNYAQAIVTPVKYASGTSTTPQLNWALNQVNRIISWGFDEMDGSSDSQWATEFQGTSGNGWPTSSGYIPTKVPFSIGNGVSAYSFEAAHGCTSPLKEIVHGLGSAPGGHAWNQYLGYDLGDYYDPNWPTCLATILSNSGFPVNSNPNYNYLMFETLDEGDQTGVLMGQSSTGNLYDSYPTTGKAAIQAQAGWTTLNASPIQTANATWYSGSYTDCNVYSKIALVNFFISEYGTIGALNSAWGSSYTTFWSSQSGFTLSTNWGTGHANCSGYTSYGTGTGLIDEGGQHTFSADPCTLLASSATFSCSTGYASPSTSTFQTDMHLFYVNFLDEFLSIQRTAQNGQLPGIMLEEFEGGWGSPPRSEALSESAKYMELPQMGTTPGLGDPNGQGKLDFIANNLGDRAFIEWEGFVADIDSGENGCATGGNTCHYGVDTGTPNYSSQAIRGTTYASMAAALLAWKSTTYSDYPIVGWYWWADTDFDNASQNWGLVSPQDNVYDGVGASETIGTDAWGYATGETKLQSSWCGGVNQPWPGCTGAGTSSWTNNSIYAGTSACVSAGTPYACCTGSFTSTNAQPCGANYGNFVGPVTTENVSVYSQLLGSTPASGGGQRGGGGMW